MGKESWSAKLKRELAEAKAELEALKLNTDDNIYTNKENKVIKIYKVAAFVGPIVGFIVGILI